MNKKWTREKVFAEAVKYTKPSEFKRNASGAYAAAVRMGIFNKVTAHMKEKKLDIKKAVAWYKANALKIKLRKEERENQELIDDITESSFTGKEYRDTSGYNPYQIMGGNKIPFDD